jgi:hypothetical protein
MVEVSKRIQEGRECDDSTGKQNENQSTLAAVGLSENGSEGVMLEHESKEYQCAEKQDVDDAFEQHRSYKFVYRNVVGAVE